MRGYVVGVYYPNLVKTGASRVLFQKGYAALARSSARRVVFQGKLPSPERLLRSLPGNRRAP